MNSDRFQRIDRSLAGEYTCLYLLLQTVGILTTNANEYTNRQFNKFLPKSLEVLVKSLFHVKLVATEDSIVKKLSTIHNFYTVTKKSTKFGQAETLFWVQFSISIVKGHTCILSNRNFSTFFYLEEMEGGGFYQTKNIVLQSLEQIGNLKILFLKLFMKYM